MPLLLPLVLGLLLAGVAQAQPGPAGAAPIYPELRARALDPATLGELGATVAAMELSLGGGATATLLAFTDGTVSLYTSSGGGYIGLEDHERVRETAGLFIREAQWHAEGLEPTGDLPLPSPGHTRFYLGTGEGLRTAEAPDAALETGEHPLSALFLRGQHLLTRVRVAVTSDP